MFLLVVGGLLVAGRRRGRQRTPVPAATQVVAVAVFVVIEFLLIIIPFVFLELRPEATKAALKHAQDWLGGHALQLMAAIALLLGTYLTVSGLIRLS